MSKKRFLSVFGIVVVMTLLLFGNPVGLTISGLVGDVLASSADNHPFITVSVVYFLTVFITVGVLAYLLYGGKRPKH